MLCLQALSNVDQPTMAAKTIADMPIPSVMNGFTVASYAARVFAPTLVEEKGLYAVKKMLDSVKDKLPEPGDDANEQRYHTMAKATLIGGYAEAMVTMGQEEMAFKYLDDEIANADEALANNLKGNVRSLKATATRNAIVGNASPAFGFGKEINGFKGMDAWKGKVVVIDFFAHWCGPCKVSFPDIRKMYDDLHDKGLEIVSVTKYYGFYNQERDLTPEQEFGKMHDFMKEFNMNWQVAYVEDSMFEEYGVTGIPTAYLVDRDGNIHSYKVGYSPESFKEFRKKVEELLAK